MSVRVARKLVRTFMHPVDSVALPLIAGRKRQYSYSALPTVKSALLLSPHPDDESLGCGGYLASVSARCTVRVLFATNGAGTGNRRNAECKRSMAARRRNEATEALKRLGCPPPVFLDFEDGSATERIDELLDVVQVHVEEMVPELLLVPFPTDPHPDHTACGLLASKLIIPEATRIAAYQVHAQIPKCFVTHQHSLDEIAFKHKESVLSVYRSQKLHRLIVQQRHTLLGRAQASRIKPSSTCVELFSVGSQSEFRQIVARLAELDARRRVKPITYASSAVVAYINNEQIFADICLN